MADTRQPPVSDTRQSSVIQDHPFVPQADRPWLCAFVVDEEAVSPTRYCDLGEAAHLDTIARNNLKQTRNPTRRDP